MTLSNAIATAIIACLVNFGLQAMPGFSPTARLEAKPATTIVFNNPSKTLRVRVRQ